MLDNACVLILTCDTNYTDYVKAMDIVNEVVASNNWKDKIVMLLHDDSPEVSYLAESLERKYKYMRRVFKLNKNAFGSLAKYRRTVQIIQYSTMFEDRLLVEFETEHKYDTITRLCSDYEVPYYLYNSTAKHLQTCNVTNKKTTAYPEYWVELSNQIVGK